MAATQITAEHHEEIRMYRKLSLATVRRLATYNFLLECKKYNIIPRTFRINHRIVGLDIENILNRASRLILNKAVRNARRVYFTAKNKHTSFINTHILLGDDILEIQNRTNQEKVRLRHKYDKKLEYLFKIYDKRPQIDENTGFINRTSKQFTREQLELLRKGPSYDMPRPPMNKCSLAADLYNAVEAVRPEERPIVEQQLTSMLTLLPDDQPSEVDIKERRICN